LPLVMRADAVAGEFQRFNRLRVGCRISCLDVGAGNGNAECAEIGLVEALRVVDQRLVAFCADAGDDVANHRIHVGRHFALGGKEGGEAGFEIGVGSIQRDSHRSAPVDRA
jgi:hypothetical protein